MPNVSLENKTVCVVDAYGLIYQAYHAPGMEMTNSKSEPTGALFGFVRDVVTIMTKLSPDYLFCAYDMHAKTFRSDVYPEYKANRPPTPDDLLLQFDFTREFLKGVRVPALGVVGFEADDLMATVARRVRELGGKTILATSDKDARQLLSDSTTIYLLRKEKFYNAPELMADWGITPDQVVDFQALVGDSSDNVPGVPLIGPKVAGELLAKYRTLEGVIAGAAGQKGKRYENLRNNESVAKMCRELVKLRDDAPVEIDWEQGRLDGVDPERLRRLFQYWNFRRFLGQLPELVAKFGEGKAEPSEWFDRIEEERRDFLAAAPAQPVPNAQPSLLDGLADEEDAPSAAANAPDDGFGAVDFDPQTPLLKRFEISQYGASVKSCGAEPRQEDFGDFELVGASSFPTLDSIPLPAATVPRANRRKTVVDDAAKLDALAERLTGARSLAVAAITNEAPEDGRVRPRFATLVGLALAVAPDEAFYLPFRAPLGENALAPELALEKLRPVLESRDVAKIGFELKYDALVLWDAGVSLRGLAFDAALADYLARSGDTRRALADVAQTYLDEQTFDVKGALGTGKSRVSFDALPLASAAEYAADAVLVPLNAAVVLRAKLSEVGALERLATELETPLVETLAEMEHNGIAIRPEGFKEASAVFLQRQEALEREIREIIAHADPDPNFANEINLNSPKQLQRLLFDDLKLRVIRKTKTGPSVDAEVLEELANEHPVPEKIVELRKIVKLRGTYLEPLPTQTLPTTNRICATFNQAATATGRLSSSDPNLQNIPARSEDGKFIRACFIPDAALGFDAFLSCDYSQIELRVLAHFSGDAELRRAFELNQDIHTSVASKIFRVDPSEVTSDMRRKAKAVNFGLVYGQTSFGLSKALGIDVSDAADYIDAFFATYPGVLAFFDRVLDDCARRGYVQTALGRRRALAGVRGARGRKTLNFPERAAINAVVQGTAADIMKLAMINVWRRLKREGWLTSHWSQSATRQAPPRVPPKSAPKFDFSDVPLFAECEEFVNEELANEPESAAVPAAQEERARLLLQIHDELLFETRREDADALAKIVVEEMRLGEPLTVPLKIDAEVGSNWGEL